MFVAPLDISTITQTNPDCCPMVTAQASAAISAWIIFNFVDITVKLKLIWMGTGSLVWCWELVTNAVCMLSTEVILLLLLPCCHKDRTTFHFLYSLARHKTWLLLAALLLTKAKNNCSKLKYKPQSQCHNKGYYNMFPCFNVKKKTHEFSHMYIASLILCLKCSVLALEGLPTWNAQSAPMATYHNPRSMSTSSRNNSSDGIMANYKAAPHSVFWGCGQTSYLFNVIEMYNMVTQISNGRKAWTLNEVLQTPRKQCFLCERMTPLRWTLGFLSLLTFMYARKLHNTLMESLFTHRAEKLAIESRLWTKTCPRVTMFFLCFYHRPSSPYLPPPDNRAEVTFLFHFPLF